MIGYYKKLLIDTFNQLKEIKQSPATTCIRSLELQRILVNRIMSIEKRIRQNGLLIHKLRKTLDKYISKEDLIQKSSQIKALTSINHQYKEIISIFRAVGDGLAFIYLNKWDVKPFVFKEPCGFISGKTGLAKELTILKRLHKENKVAILNDITNCLRYGDITVPINGFPYLIEVKSSKFKTKRSQRQLENANRILNYLTSDRIEKLYGIGPVIRVNSQYSEKNYVEELNDCIERAYKDGYCAREIEKGLTYYVESRLINERFLSSIFSKVKRPFVFFVNDVKHIPMAYHPFTLSIGSPERLYDFYSGRFLISVIVDLHTLSAKFLKKGLEVDYQRGSYPLVIRRKSKSDDLNCLNQLKISDYLWGRLGCEFWSLNQFVDETIKVMNHKW